MLFFSLAWVQICPRPLFTLCPCSLLGHRKSQAPCSHPARQRETDPGHTQIGELHSPVAPEPNRDIWNSKTCFLWLHQSLFLSYGSTGQWDLKDKMRFYLLREECFWLVEQRILLVLGCRGRKRTPDGVSAPCGSACPSSHWPVTLGQPLSSFSDSVQSSEGSELDDPQSPCQCKWLQELLFCLLFSHEITVSPSPLSSRFTERSSKPSLPGKGEQWENGWENSCWLKLSKASQHLCWI